MFFALTLFKDVSAKETKSLNIFVIECLGTFQCFRRQWRGCRYVVLRNMQILWINMHTGTKCRELLCESVMLKICNDSKYRLIAEENAGLGGIV